jgi:putative membrane protein
MRWLLHWIFSAVSLMIAAHFVPGMHVHGFLYSMLAVAIIGLVNATLGLFLKIITFPLTIITFGLFLIVINACMLKFASFFTPGFVVDDWWAALWGSIILSVLHFIFHRLTRKRREND